MSIETQAQAIESMVNALLADDPGYFLIEIRIRPTNNVKVFIDGDAGVSIEKCTFYNRKLYKEIENSGIFPGNDFSLEVSSPGLDEPLKLFRQYKKNIGRKVEVLLRNGIKVEGKLTEVSDEGIAVEEMKGTSKKPELQQHSFPFNEIKSTKIQILFKN